MNNEKLKTKSEKKRGAGRWTRRLGRSKTMVSNAIQVVYFTETAGP
jgi:hypothetical protein